MSNWDLFARAIGQEATVQAVNLLKREVGRLDAFSSEVVRGCNGLDCPVKSTLDISEERGVSLHFARRVLSAAVDRIRERAADFLTRDAWTELTDSLIGATEAEPATYDQIETVRRYYNRLPELERDVLRLRWGLHSARPEILTQKETALQLEISPSRVASLERRGLGHLKALLENPRANVSRYARKPKRKAAA